MLKVRSLPRSPTACFSARTMDVTETLSPGRAESTRSSSNLTSRYLGSCPGGRSSGLSCIRASCVFLNFDCSCKSSNEVLCLQTGSDFQVHESAPLLGLELLFLDTFGSG